MPVSPVPFLACRDLELRRAPGTPSILRDFDLEVAEGEFVCILGPSGCGKTTLLNLLAGFIQPTRGDALLDGAPIASASRDRGVIFQSDDALFGWLTARENVGFGLKMRGVPGREWRAEADRYLALVGLAAHADKFPDELSGGMKQRVQIARALANDPKILLMDEPFGALDAQTRAMMQSEVVRIWAETRKTIVFITHDIGEAVILADRIVVMTAGPEARVKAVIDVEAPRPRLQTSIECFQYAQRCHALIEEEVTGALAVTTVDPSLIRMPVADDTLRRRA
jgi:NitT/TauT family transport system ATP-binding protein